MVEVEAKVQVKLGNDESAFLKLSPPASILNHFPASNLYSPTNN